MEGDFIVSQRSDVRTGFQSTPSAWRETTTNAAMSGIVVDISIHSLRMEGDIYRMLRIQNKIISIHSLRMEGDLSLIHI